ncbi:MAG: hypothetical protein Q7S01_02770 [bacterium]|nr:hypothetical protein [bacterium]
MIRSEGLKTTTDALEAICLPAFFEARAELAAKLESVALLATEEGKVISTRFTSLVIIAKWIEYSEQSNSVILKLGDELIGSGVLDLEGLNGMAKDAMLANKPINLLNQE